MEALAEGNRLVMERRLVFDDLGEGGRRVVAVGGVAVVLPERVVTGGLVVDLEGGLEGRCCY